MKEIYTSYYEMLPQIKDKFSNFSFICISNTFPESLRHLQFYFEEKLYPGWELVSAIQNNSITWSTYEYTFNFKLDSLDCRELYNSLPDKCILFCYENPSSNCHRHLVAEWLNSNIDGLMIKELEFDQDNCKTSKFNIY